MWSQQRGNAVPLHTYRSALLAGGAECKIGGHCHDHVRMLSMHNPMKDELLGFGVGHCRFIVQGPSHMLLQGFRAGAAAAALIVVPTPPSSSFSTLSSSFVPFEHHLDDREIPMYGESSRPREESMRAHLPLASPSFPSACHSQTPALQRHSALSMAKQTLQFDVQDSTTGAVPSPNTTRRSVVRAGAVAAVSTSVYKGVKMHQYKQEQRTKPGNDVDGKSEATLNAGLRSTASNRAKGRGEAMTAADWNATVESAPRWSQLRSYRFIRSLGKGAHAEAILMERGIGEERGRPEPQCVLKVSEFFLPEAINEARLLGRLSASPYVVRLEDMFIEQVGGRLVSYLQLEYCGGGDLSSVLRRYTEVSHHALDDLSVHRLANQLLAALESLHSQNVIHRDFKPDNILLTAEGRVKLCDFGIATRLTDACSGWNNFAAGSLPFMSPEIRRLLQYKSRDEDDKGGEEAVEVAACTDKADVWAFGCVLYAMCLSTPTPNLVNVPALQAVAEVCGHRGWPAFDFSLGPLGIKMPGLIAQQVCWLLTMALEPDLVLRPSAVELRRALTSSKADSEENGTGLAARL
ncbi:hypothetical protein VYU27_005030 [Nannochloropsis oceanica]